jgi:hypothetical protein
MPSQSPHPYPTPVVRNVRRLGNRQNKQKRRPSGNTQLPPAERHVSAVAGNRITSQGVSSVPSSIHSQNSIPLSLQNNSGVADITQYLTSTLPATLRQSIILQLPGKLQAVVPHQHPEGPYRQSQ